MKLRRINFILTENFKIYSYCAMTSLPLTIGSIALCWMAEGLSNPNNKKVF